MLKILTEKRRKSRRITTSNMEKQKDIKAKIKDEEQRSEMLRV